MQFSDVTDVCDRQLDFDANRVYQVINWAVAEVRIRWIEEDGWQDDRDFWIDYCVEVVADIWTRLAYTGAPLPC